MSDSVAPDPYGDDCSQVLEQMQAYLHAEMAQDKRELLAEHLHRCVGCTDEMDDFELRAYLQTLLRRCCPCDPAPTQLRERVVTVLGQMSSMEISSMEISVTHTQVTIWETDGR